MLKLGTLFSGIGAIEHALERMGIPYEIEFAIDNGDVDILSKEIENNILAIEEEFVELSEHLYLTSEDILGDESLKKEWLEKPLQLAKDRFELIKQSLNLSKITKVTIQIIIDDLYNSGKLNKNQASFYNKVRQNLTRTESNVYISYELMNAYIKLDTDIRKLEGKTIDKSSFWKGYNKISLTDFKKVVKEVKLIKEELSMLHERINTEAIRRKVFQLKTLEEQKAMVDLLYKSKESNNKVKQSYFANYNIDDSKFHWNVSFFDGKHFQEKIDLLVGGSPCQSFSLVGKQRGLGDTRGTLFYEFARIVSEVKPKVFIYENVKAVLSNDEGRTWETMKQVFSELGYNWYQTTMNAKDYGVPQNRERIFVVGFRNDLGVNEFQFPSPIQLTKTMKDYLIDNVSGKYYLPPKGAEFVLKEKNLEKRYTQIDGDIQLCQKKNQQFNWHGDFIFEEENKDREKSIQDLEKYFLSEKVKKYVLSSGTKGFYSKPETDLDIARPLLKSMHKMHRAGIDNYVTTEGRLRKLTPRECLRLMGFCDSFKIVVSDTSMYQQSGNSIVVDVLIAIMKNIIKSYPKIV
ncbi:DNA cytosine methyltransferase [Streptococcus mitis]|uniref:DNA cytosine methyltransferase n=1 Tax=Streptococcus mitis TaxID=28037 RepID=UPI001CEC3EDD|nr:DNA cytosine methyltransferase [Streptococcus mitis]